VKDAIYFVEEPKVNCLQLFLLHRFIGSHVKVSLSGLGGDELFAGYDFYRYLRGLQRARAVVPRTLARRALEPALDRAAAAVSGLARPGLDQYARELEWAGSVHDGVRSYLLLRNGWDCNPSLLRRVYTPEFLARLA